MNMNTYYAMTSVYITTSAEGAARALKRGVVAEHLDHAPEQAKERYLHAFDAAVKDQDLMFGVLCDQAPGRPGHSRRRHGRPRLPRRSYRLRAAPGAHPRIASAAVTLGACLPPGAEAGQTKETAAHTARELGPTWLIKAL
ncbi:hypothetical protein SAMN05216276_103478 [Streptosporangium subroseum]|uniref:Uncharacterized protein n=1 Tax=Streptosporangium subroseum TaxID=106412 RepID=A0A239LQL7_9ACTN|nr:hypothetical protein [Streptosporangium subroseum]SNT32675.1 hypothetical protein SAMN05216276_103478 [Streptosporangium subroseum]